jgi:cytochrome c oxidase cbb3-type subunit III
MLSGFFVRPAVSACTAVVLLFFVAVLAVPAQNRTASAQTAAPKSTAILQRDDVKRGAQQFLQSCSFCHGPNANGGTEGPNLILSTVVRHDGNGELIGPVIREGRPAKGMPAFSFNAQQIADIVAFLHARIFISDQRSAGGTDTGYPLGQLLTGNAEAGKTFFFGAGGCSGCHSVSGDLAGIARKYSPVELQARFLYPDSEHVHQTATVSFPSGKQVSGELISLDTFSVAIKDADGWYHSWPLSKVKVQTHDPLAAHEKLLTQYTAANMHDLFAYLETLKK